MLCNAYDDMTSFSYHNTRGVTPIVAPLSTSEKLSLHEGSLLAPNDATHYRNIIGPL
jgi:hypothetical protein